MMLREREEKRHTEGEEREASMVSHGVPHSRADTYLTKHPCDSYMTTRLVTGL